MLPSIEDEGQTDRITENATDYSTLQPNQALSLSYDTDL